MSTSESAEPAKPPGQNPRVQRTRKHALATARELLLERGPLQLTYSALCERSGLTRQTLYRHWPTREALLADVVLTGPDTAYPSPGIDPHVVIVEFLQSLRAGMSDMPTATALLSLAAQAERDPGSANALSVIIEDRREALNLLLRGTHVTVDADDFAVLCGPVLYRQLLARRPPTDQLIDRVVQTWLNGPAKTE